MVAALRDRQPDGPYTLTGRADELAERLRAAGLDARVLAESALDAAADGTPLDRAAGSAGTASALDGPALSGPWRDLLRGAPRLELPADRSPSAPRGGAVTTRPFRFSADESRALGAGGRGDAAWVATVVALLARLSGEPDVVVGMRLGQAAALLPIRVRTGDDPSFAELRRRVTDAVTAAERLVPPEPAAGDAPGRPHPLLSAAIEFDAAGAPSLATPAGRVDVLWRIRLDGDEVSGSLTCDGDRFRPRTAPDR